MSWARISVLATALAAAVAPGVAAAAIVVASSGPSARNFPVGKKLEDNATVVLQAGDTVTVLDARGTRVLRGAGSISLAKSGGAAATATFAALTRQRSSARVRTGAVRGETTGAPVRSPNLWYVDVAKSGTACVIDPASVRLWRAAPAKAANYTISGGAGSAAVGFAAGAMVAPWDAARLPVSDGASYVLVDSSGKQVSRITIALLASAPATPEATAAALIEKGCQAQLDLLSASLAVSGR